MKTGSGHLKIFFFANKYSSLTCYFLKENSRTFTQPLWIVIIRVSVSWLDWTRFLFFILFKISYHSKRQLCYLSGPQRIQRLLECMFFLAYFDSPPMAPSDKPLLAHGLIGGYAPSSPVWARIATFFTKRMQ